jgi:predicted glycoside hydrolase/deacetylase ChbG (UPF0249 family)
MKKILITADDYGMCQPVDTAIDECIAAGLVTTTNVILNMETLNNAKTLKTRFPHISVGIHWNVTTGKPLLETEQISTLVDENGNFFTLSEFKKRMSKGDIKKNHLKAELRAQYKAFYELCGKPDYWNTHENSALCLKAFNIFSRLAKEYGIPATRNFQRVYIDIESVPFKRRLKECVHKVAADILFGIIIKGNFVMPDARLFPFRLESKFDINKLMSVLNSSRCNSIEIVAHPAVTTDHKFFGNISKDRLDEYAFFSNNELRKIFEKNGLMLTNFAGICN